MGGPFQMLHTQAVNLFRRIDEPQRQRLMDAIAGAMAGVPETIIRRALAHFSKADPAYGAGIAARLGFAIAAE